LSREIQWVLIATVVLFVSSTSAELYARTMTPFYAAVAEIVSRVHPWRVLDVRVESPPGTGRRVVELVGEVRQNRSDPLPAAAVEGHLQIDSILQTPVIFWTVILLWPSRSFRRKLVFAIAGIPIFLIAEAATTVAQLISPLAQASAMLAGDSDPLTLWERWNRLMEAGGRLVVAFFGALLAVVLTTRFAQCRGVALALVAGSIQPKPTSSDPQQ
jgi:hypothetical protein